MYLSSLDTLTIWSLSQSQIDAHNDSLLLYRIYVLTDLQGLCKFYYYHYFLLHMDYGEAWEQASTRCFLHQAAQEVVWSTTMKTNQDVHKK